MKKPIIFVIDDDPQVIRAIARDLRSKYRQNYRIMSTESPQEALDALPDLKKKEEEVAAFVTDQRMPQMLGVEFLAEAKKYYPTAKKVLLTAYSDVDAAIKAINDVQLDYYLSKPWDPPEEKLYPVLDDLLADWQSRFVPSFQGIKVIGYQYSPKSHEIKDFLAGNLVSYQWLNVEKSDKACELLELNNIAQKDLPVVFFEDGNFLTDPSINQLAERVGMNLEATESLYDVVIIGAGPAGLAAAVYGSSERTQNPAGRKTCAGRAGGHQLAHRELPGLPQRTQRC